MRQSLLRPFLAVFLVLALLAGCAPTAVPGSPTASSTPSAVGSAPTAAPTLAPTVSPTAAPPSPTAVSDTPTASASASATPAGFPLTVTDDAGRRVTFDRPPRRIISLSPGHTETLYALGLGDEVAMTDTYSTYPAENKPKAKLDTYPKPNVEQIVALRPDLVVVLVEGNDFIQQMDARHIPVLKVFPQSFAGTLKDIDLLGQVTGTEARATRITDQMRARADAVVAKTRDAPKPRVLYELDASDPTRPFVAGSGGFYGDLVPMAGGTNVFADVKAPDAQVSAEQIVARDPQIILLADATSPYNAQTPAMVKARQGWSQISAVRDGKIYPIDADLLTRPGPRLADGLEALAKVIHPELFK
ncbi:MAG: ABC transporter substrate-binding protein [Chloroflexota bacterium]